MGVIDRIRDFHADLTAWRRDIHANPETAFEEHRTAAFVAEKLESFGVQVHRGLARTGVVGTLKAGTGNRAIGLRADMDALHLEEKNQFGHRSTVAGKMHACGHDGHTIMLLGAARYLAETRNFDGTVHFIFQPAEENEGGGRVMVEEGLFERFPVESVFGMHNMPGIPLGKMAVRSGPVMASADFFDIRVRGVGAHGAYPHTGIDPIVVGSEIVMAAQTIVSRNADPMKSAVVSITQFNGGHTTNVIPEDVVLRGTARAFLPGMQDLIEKRLKRICEGVGMAHGAEVACTYQRLYPPTINTADETDLAAAAAMATVGAENTILDLPPMMGAEDFSWMLKERPGCYVFLGNGDGAGSCMIHNPLYDFNDEAIPLGASYWANLTEQVLRPAAR